MCGRYVLTITLELFIKHFGLKEIPNWPARYNIAPTQKVPVIRQFQDGPRQVDLLRWGLVPSWSKELSGGMINARGETVNEKPSFRHAFRQRRCIIPASGFYEWRKIGNRKTPYFIHRANHDPMAFAGIWDTWRSPEGENMETCAILTTQANAVVAKLHDRMPVILPCASFDDWLDPQLHDPAVLSKLLVPCPPETIATYPVSTLVNKVGNEGPECIEEVDEVDG
ncbi:MAG TPA: SOS response-associated peptidase [Geomobilimonas sp.]|nr:SOS response-associated peptidase [Geomobilimonas sp.]